MKKTKILCTLGPATMSKKVLTKMVVAGMNAARVNTAYGSLKSYCEMVRGVRSVADIPIVFDIKGPEIRVNAKGEREVKKNEVLLVGFKPKDEISFNRNIYSQLRVGDKVILGKGKSQSTVVGKSNGYVRLKVRDSLRVRDGLGVNIPERSLKIPTISSRDAKVIGLAKKLGIDYIALSFTRNLEDVKNLRRRLSGSDIAVIAKIENREGIENIDEIIRACDGVMIARGDLGVEIPSQEIPLIQKDIIVRCNRMGKISIVATEMMQSMVSSPQPTRAETSDVANAILDGADSVMLSAESAIGKYPVEAVKAMTKIAFEVECHMPIAPLDEEAHDMVSMAISKAVTSIIETIEIDRIVVATRSGYTAMLISNFRVCKDIIAITDNHRVCRKLHLVYAVQPILLKLSLGKKRIVELARYCLRKGLIKRKDLVLFVSGIYIRKASTNSIQLHRISELLGYRSGKK